MDLKDYILLERYYSSLEKELDSVVTEQGHSWDEKRFKIGILDKHISKDNKETELRRIIKKKGFHVVKMFDTAYGTFLEIEKLEDFNYLKDLYFEE